VLDVVLIYVGAQVVVLVVAAIVSSQGVSAESTVPLLLVLSPIAVLALTSAWIGLRYQGRLRPVTGRRGPRLGDVGIGVGIGIASLIGQRVIVGIIAIIASRFDVDLPVVQETFRMIAQRPDVAPLLVLTAVLLAPVAEEVLFRGILFQGLRAQGGFWLAAVVSAALFTLAHLGEDGGWFAIGIIASGIFPLGLVFAALVERRGSLLVSIVAHASYNAIGVAALILAPDVAV
jgi:membrane protease YdiL (CAAX protease family)